MARIACFGSVRFGATFCGMRLPNLLSLRTVSITAASLLTAAGVLAAGVVPAEAHAIIELNGKQAYAGQTSIYTMEIQHGCMSNEGQTLKVMVFYGAAFRNLVPRHVAGWKSRVVAGHNGGHTVVWTTQGAAQVFNVPLYLPTRVTWPHRAGVYGIPVKQFCKGGTSVAWTTPFTPATANAPSPPLTPLPQIQVK